MKNVLCVRIEDQYIQLIDDIYIYYRDVEKDKRSKGDVIEEILENGIYKIVNSIYVSYHLNKIYRYDYKIRGWKEVEITDEVNTICNKLFEDTINYGYVLQ